MACEPEWGCTLGVFGAKDLLGPVARQIFDNVGKLAAAVVAPPRVTLGIFIGKDRAGRFKHRLRDKVFAGNHLQAFVLAEGFVVESCGHFGVGLGERQRHAVGHIGILDLFPPRFTGRLCAGSRNLGMNGGADGFSIGAVRGFAFNGR